MSRLQTLLNHVLEDRKITEAEVSLIRDYIGEDGKLDQQDAKFLVELLSNANEVCPAFDKLFFPVLKHILLQDGKIGQDEQFYLLKMLYSDGRVRQSERDFLEQLRQEADDVTPEFEHLCETALAAPTENWDVGGQSR